MVAESNELTGCCQKTRITLEMVGGFTLRSYHDRVQ